MERNNDKTLTSVLTSFAISAILSRTTMTSPSTMATVATFASISAPAPTASFGKNYHYASVLGIDGVR
jgi:hypothetical protein